MPITVIADTETNGFKPDKFHCIEVICCETSDILSFSDDPRAKLMPLREGIALLEAADYVVGHGFLQFDRKWLEIVHGAQIIRERVRDTLVASRILFPDLRDEDSQNPNMPTKLHGKHSLEAWGYRLNVLKGDFKKTADWRYWSPEMQSYCKQDCMVTAALYLKLLDAGYDQ
jgi:DNA polymerase I